MGAENRQAPNVTPAFDGTGSTVAFVRPRSEKSLPRAKTEYFALHELVNTNQRNDLYAISFLIAQSRQATLEAHLQTSQASMQRSKPGKETSEPR